MQRLILRRRRLIFFMSPEHRSDQRLHYLAQDASNLFRLTELSFVA